jgi:hypothetical protein
LVATWRFITPAADRFMTASYRQGGLRVSTKSLLATGLGNQSAGTVCIRGSIRDNRNWS